MKIRGLIFSGFIIVAFITLVLGVTGIISTLSLTGIARDLESLQGESSAMTVVVNKHYQWIQEISESVLTGSEFTMSLDPLHCILTDWEETDEARRMNDPKLLSLLADLQAPHAYMHNEGKKAYEIMMNGDMDEAWAHLKNVVLPEARRVIATLTSMEEQYNELVDVKEMESESLSIMMERVNIILVVVALIASVVMAYYISHKICEPLIPVSAFMEKAALNGDLTIEKKDEAIIAKYSDAKNEIGQLVHATASFINRVTDISKSLVKVADGDLTTEVKQLSDKDTLGHSLIAMMDNLNNMFEEIDASAKQVSSGAKHIADGAQSLAQSSTEQASSVEKISDHISSIAEMTKTNAEMAGQAAKLACEIRETAEKGSGQMTEMISAVDDINTASHNIGKVIKVIDEIAFQTNILALNAAVEAARAGTHGKGFAVVAEEVRNLAAKSADAAEETGSMIQNSFEKAKLGAKIAGETASSLADIVAGIGKSNDLIQGIAQSSAEQSSSISNVNVSIDEVAQVVQHNSATAQESAAASEQMSSQSSVLEDMLTHFKLKGGRLSSGGRLLTDSAPAPHIPPKSIALDSMEIAEGYGKY